MKDPKGRSIVAIEYTKHKSGWKPHSVMAGNDCYDFDWCEMDQALVYHCSGGGMGGEYTIFKFAKAPKVGAKLWYDRENCRLVYDGKTIDEREARKLGYQVIKDPLDGNPFEDDDAYEDQAIYCHQCGDYHPEESMCHHVQWDDEGGGFFLGCGAEEIDFGDTQESLYRLLRMLSPIDIHGMLKGILNGSFCLSSDEHLMDKFSWERNFVQRYLPGVAWLFSLDKSCKEARALTAGWIWMFLRKGWYACCTPPQFAFWHQLSLCQFNEWLALDPLDPWLLHDRPLRVSLDFEPTSANDLEFLSCPERCREVYLLPPPRNRERIAGLGLKLSVAEVKQVSKKSVDIYFGAVIERNGQHVSELDGYDLGLV